MSGDSGWIVALGVSVGHLLILALATGMPRPTATAVGDEATGPDSLPTAERSRITVAVLPFEDGTGDPNLAHWRYMAPGLLRDHLAHVSSLRIRSETAVKYGLRQAGLSPGDAIDPNEARMIGEHIEAQRVIWGRCREDKGQRHLDAWLVNVASGKASGPFPATGVDGFDLRNTLGEQILPSLDLTPTKEERRKMTERWTVSSEALAWYGKGYMLQEQGRPVAEMETCFRRALACDPNCARVLAALAATLVNRGQFGPAEDMARRALQIDDNDASTHAILGFILGNQRRFDEARDAVRQACRLDRDDADHLTLLAQLYALEGKWDEVRAFLETAVSLEPTNAGAHAALAEAHVAAKNEQAALHELKEAAYFMPERMAALNVHLKLAETFERLGRTSEAVERYARIVDLATQLGMSPDMIRLMESRAKRLEGRLSPTLIRAAMPRRYSEPDLDAALSARLDEAQRSLVGNPFHCTEAMQRWARELTRDSTTDTEKARAIFDGLVTRTDAGGQARSRIAREVFADWDNPEVRLVCMDHAVLFVALARAADVNAFFTQVTRDPAGTAMNHACAAIFDGDRVLLADSSQRWFGAPHQEYVILDDLQTAGFLCLYNRTAGIDPATMCRVGLDLWPDSRQGRLCLACALLTADRPDEARQVLADADSPTTEGFEGSLYWMAQGMLAESQGDLERAEEYLRKAAAQCATQSSLHFRLGHVCLRRGRLAEARTAFRDCLRNDPGGLATGLVRQSIAQINEKIGFDLPSDAATPKSVSP